MRAVDILRLNKKKEEGYKIWGVEIDTTNSNPLTSVTYTHNAIGMTPGSSAWDNTPIFSGIKPCLLNNGSVNYYLDPNDFSKREGGVLEADITSGSDGDVMIEIPKIGYKIETVGNTLKVQLTDNPNKKDDGFCYYAHTRTTEGDKDYLYIGAYDGHIASSRLRSLSGKAPDTSTTFRTFRTCANNLGSGYDCLSFFPVTLIQCLFLIRYKNLDSQSALGEGYSHKDNSDPLNTGATNSSGMYFGGTNKQAMKFIGIENLWGNVATMLDGFMTMANEIFVAFDNFNEDAIGYDYVGDVTKALTGAIQEVNGTNFLGFTVKESNPDANAYDEYFCDNGGFSYTSGLRFPLYGGHYYADKQAGVFYNRVTAANFKGTWVYVGARLMYL